jgi:hypothetical protein
MVTFCSTQPQLLALGQEMKMPILLPARNLGGNEWLGNDIRANY